MLNPEGTNRFDLKVHDSGALRAAKDVRQYIANGVARALGQ
jgi:hypothetical protein